MKLSDFYRNGKRYDGRPETFVKRIVDGGLFELTDNNGYLEIFEVTIYFKNGTEQKYNRDKLKLKKYNPNTRKHEIFVEKKLPPHCK